MPALLYVIAVLLVVAGLVGIVLPALPGTVLEASGDRFIVAAGHGSVRILELRPEGRRTMTARDFLAGHPIAVGARME